MLFSMFAFGVLGLLVQLIGLDTLMLCAMCGIIIAYNPVACVYYYSFVQIKMQEAIDRARRWRNPVASDDESDDEFDVRQFTTNR